MMAAPQLSVIPSWSKPLETFRSELFVIPKERDSVHDTARLRRNLEESRKAFLNFPEESTTFVISAPIVERKPPTKKISFKIKKTASIYRRKEKTAQTKVQELAKRYNSLVESSEPRMNTRGIVVQRVNSLKKESAASKVSRKPSVKIKPDDCTINRKCSVKKTINLDVGDNGKGCVRAKISYLEGPKLPEKNSDNSENNVKATIAIFEQKSAVPKPKVPEKTFDVKNLVIKNQEKRMKIIEQRSKTQKTEEADFIVQVVNIPLIPPKKCDSRYETMQLKKVKELSAVFKEEDVKVHQEDAEEHLEKEEEISNDYDIVEPPKQMTPPPLPPKPCREAAKPVREAPKPPIPAKSKPQDIYEELRPYSGEDDDGYEICSPEENIYETLPAPKIPTRCQEPLPPRPPSRNSYYSRHSNIYESIYSKKDDDVESNYESIYIRDRSSIVSDQQSNSIYGQSITSWAEDVLNTYIDTKPGSELSGSSDKSDDWVDLSDHENNYDNSTGFVVLRGRHQKVSKKISGWSQQLRHQWKKAPRNQNYDNGDSDSDHHYETLYVGQIESNKVQPINDDDFDSFDSDSESDHSFAKTDSGVDMGNTQLPEPPSNQIYVFTRLAVSAGKHMKRLRRNWSLTKNDITKSLSRMTKRKSRTDLDAIDKVKEREQEMNTYQDVKPYSNVGFSQSQEQLERTKSLGRKGFLNKFRRSMSISGENAENTLNEDGSKPKSTFYLTDTIDLDRKEVPEVPPPVPPNNTTVKPKTSPVRPQIPPPPAPTKSPNIEMRNKDTKRSSSWYAECGLFKNSQQGLQLPKRPNTFWYAEVGLYQSSTASSPSTSSGENKNDDEYYNLRNENDYYNSSITSFESSDTKKDEAFNSLSGELQLRLQDEPLYQFYDAAVMESVCQDGSSDSDYEEVGGKKHLEIRLRPTAMELIAPPNSNVSVARTLWCEIPEVVQSAVLSTLSVAQKKLQEAKFEMLTSEASYLNSLNVLSEHFVRRLSSCEFLTYEEKTILFSKVVPVKECSEKLLGDLETCWQDNILLHGVCDIIKKHAEENFEVYVDYCANQILLDQSLKKLKDRTTFTDFLKQLESSSACQLLTLHSFLMLPMQRITRWPLLMDAVLKRLSPQDEEYLSCQHALALLNKIVCQCNEGARKMERMTEMKRIAEQLDFPKSITPLTVVTGSRWLVRSGLLNHMQNRGEDVKLTFGKRFVKVPLYLFLFNDILIVAKLKGEDNYVVQHYCYRSYLEINGETLACLPIKDAQGRHLIFLTILENHEGKTVELLLSCSSETDKERWLEALSPPKSENPDETLYECWDCPQVTAVHNYTANQPDELALSRGDIINVTRKMADGWYHGERIRDGETGWFPANYTVEVANPHVRARNLKQRYRLLAFSENYLKSK
ncbi:PREDICTED: uncharacterized protein LOC108561925 [Nicrophorus vespilloides]|uniref:Uncharacterized protein LOC108561925 n=1 Tax=Nicrophorus vespilloides TaxID=110193 RepID=A0ABM1MLW3_NICVS|nr:PREDICTED: uncharacterized protein LOC108561925 [Nicrophorus vespilloides]